MQVAIRIFSVPKKGSCLVRFLGGPTGLLMHRDRRGVSTPCPGEDVCRDHDGGKWKGYAPCQRWDRELRKWIPVVFEMTEGAVSCCGSQDLRGQGWEFARHKTRYAEQEVQGTHLSDYETRTLPGPFDVTGPVERMLGTHKILWGVRAEVYLSPTAETSDDPPPTQEAPKKRIEAPTTEQFSELRAGVEASKRKLAEKMKEGPGLPEPSSNGSPGKEGRR